MTYKVTSYVKEITSKKEIESNVILRYNDEVIKSNELEVKIGIDNPKTGIAIPLLTLTGFAGIFMILKHNKKNKMYKI